MCISACDLWMIRTTHGTSEPWNLWMLSAYASDSSPIVSVVYETSWSSNRTFTSPCFGPASTTMPIAPFMTPST